MLYVVPVGWCSKDTLASLSISPLGVVTVPLRLPEVTPCAKAFRYVRCSMQVNKAINVNFLRCISFNFFTNVIG